MPPLHRHSSKNGPAPVVWLDVDDTVLDFTGAHPSGVRAVERWAGRHMDPLKAKKLAELFDRCFRVSLRHWHKGGDGTHATLQTNGGKASDDSALADRLTRRLERVTADGPRPVRWAREVWLEIAAEDSGVKLPREEVTQGTAEYWKALAPAQKLYAGVAETVGELRVRGYRTYLVSSSDCRLIPGQGGWRYEPGPAMEWKRARMKDALRPIAGLVEGLVLGDPYEKSGPEFFRHALEQTPLAPGGFVITVGDSLESDIKYAREADERVRFGVLCDPHGRYPAGPLPGADARIDQVSGLLQHFF